MEKDKERMLELLADQTLFGLTEEETAELENFKNRFPEFKDDRSFEMAAAAINLIDLKVEDALPANLQTKLEMRAEEFVGAPTKARQFANVENNQTAELPQDAFARSIDEFVPAKTSIRQWLGWAVAAAACVALAINLWLTRVQPQPEIAKNPEAARMPEIIKTPTPELTAAQKREQLIASAPDVIQKNWTSPKDKEKILGDIVWSNSQQKGFMRLRGLPVNDPNQATYQLWIADAARAEKKALSGGVFDVNETGEVVIPIEAELKVKSPKEFNITREKPGGVVVSSPERIVAIAKI